LNSRFLISGLYRRRSLSIDNNAAANVIRPFVIGRKNGLFSDTPKGAARSAKFGGYRSLVCRGASMLNFKSVSN